MTTATIVIISKNEGSLSETLESLQHHEAQIERDVLVVDASEGRLDGLAHAHPDVQWVQYVRPPRQRKVVTIPEQRNLGARLASGDIIVYVDSGVRPQAGWLDALVAPLLDGSESVTVGSFRSTQPSPYDARTFDEKYVEEAPTLNMAFLREAFDEVGGFDEKFSYCSDSDFCWRLVERGHRIRMVAEAEVLVDWGGTRRQNRRAWYYGAGRARLYRKHPRQLRSILRRDPIMVVYPLFLLGLPLTALVPAYPLLLLVPIWRSRKVHPLRTVADHLCYGAGALGQVLRVAA